MSLQKVMVVGAGAWGTALGVAAVNAGCEVVVVARDKAQVEAINIQHRNRAYLGDIALPDVLRAQIGFAGIADADIVILAVPAQVSRETLKSIGPNVLADKPVILSAKGFEAGTLMLQSQILAEVAPEAVPLILSGPSFAVDVAAGRPTAVTLAGNDEALTEIVAATLASARFRPYVSGDVKGVELAGGLKNVYALACGAVDGAGLGLSARSSVLARAFSEMSRLVAAMGGDAITMTGLAGIGDLALSCTSEQSRNYKFGVLLGQRKSVAEIETSGVGLAEGVKTAPVALEMAKKAKVDVPLIEAVNLLLAGRAEIDQIVAGLMTRPLKREGENL